MKLRAYRSIQLHGDVPHYDGWLFPSRRPAEGEKKYVIDQRAFVHRHFEPARRSVTKEHITPHMLRHTWCSLAVARYPVAYVSKWAGHSDVSFTYRTNVQAIASEESRLANNFGLGRRR
ncbi:MAG: Phage integrase family [Thermoanaerobaculia bacterium]|jgi:integrase|nr:Phage integrase family [Thermoanaerobaculia bacterium]